MATKKRKTRRTGAKRVSAALRNFLRKQNPAFKKATHVRMTKAKSGAITFTPVRANVAGYKDSAGVFHPIRAAFDYDPGRTGEFESLGKGLRVPRRKKGKRNPAKLHKYDIVNRNNDQFATVEARTAKEAMRIWNTKLWHRAPQARGLRAVRVED